MKAIAALALGALLTAGCASTARGLPAAVEAAESASATPSPAPSPVPPTPRPAATATQTPAEILELRASLDALVASFDGGVGLWIADPGMADPIYEVNADEVIVAASLYKLAILLHVESLVDRGELSYEDELLVPPSAITEDGSYVPAGAVLSVDDALELMIAYSDNGTALAFWHEYGPRSINESLRREEIDGLTLAETGLDDNLTTPRALGAFFTRLARRELVSFSASERMIERLLHQKISDRLPALLPPGALVAHKTGNLVGLVHDAGILFGQRGARVVVAMTWDAADDVAGAFIAMVGRAAHAGLR